MLRIKSIAAFLLIITAGSLQAEEFPLRNFKNTYSLNDSICKRALELIRSDKLCRPYDSICNEKDTFVLNVEGKPLLMFKEVATNEYGYTQVYRSTATSLNGFAVIYVQRFQGDQHPRLVETWKVDATDLEKVLKTPPGPWPYKKWIKMKYFQSRETNAPEFTAMLHQGEKLTDEWSPVIEINGEPYLIERECSGTWVFGGYYACNRVIKLTIKKPFKDKKAVPYCQYTKTNK